MENKLDYCAIVQCIRQAPQRNISDWGILTVRHYLGLQEHLKSCDECCELTDLILEENKDVPSRPSPESLN